MRKKLKNRTQLPAELPLGKPNWLTGSLLYRGVAMLVVASVLSPLVLFFVTALLSGAPSVLSTGFFLPLVAFLISVLWLAFAARRLRADSLDGKERALASASSLLIFAGLVGAWQSVSSPLFLLGGAVFALGLIGAIFVARSYQKANRWLAQVWSHENPTWKISEERMLSGWDDLPKVIHSSNDEMFDTLLLRYEEDPGDDAPYRQANKKVPYAKVPFERALATKLFQRAIRLQIAKVLLSLAMLIPLADRFFASQQISEEYCTHSGFVDIIQTDRGLFTLTQDGRLLLSREQGEWRMQPNNPPADAQITGVWGLHDDLFLSSNTGAIYRLSLTSGEWSLLYQDKASLNDIYGYEIDSESTVILAVGEGGTTVRSMDGGLTWTTQRARIINEDEDVPDYEISSSIYALWGNRNGGFYAVGSDGLILHSGNSGASWQRDESPTEDSLVSVWGAEADGKIPGQIYAVSATGTVIFSTRGSWNKFDNFFKFRPSGIFGIVDTTSPESQKSAYAKAKHLYVVGQQGVITRHDGFGWSPMKSGTGMALWGGLVTDEGLFIIGSNGSLLFSDDDGETFSSFISPLDYLMRCTVF